MNYLIRRYKNYIMIAVLALVTITLVGCSGSNSQNDAYTTPITSFTSFWDIFVYPISGIMWVMGKTIAFGNYGVAIILTTLIVRTMAWPIYAKTNDMSLKMQLMQPELDKLQARYAGKDDQQSKQRMSAETMQLYKKYGVGIGGCLMPLVQMPIFIGFFQAISRMPATLAAEGANWLKNAFTSVSIFGIDLTIQLSDDGVATKEKVAIYILAALVGITQVISILLSQMRQKKQKAKQMSAVPEYRRQQQNDTAKQTTMMMNIMMYVMAAMMVWLVIQRPAGLGLYWLIGNIYTTLQMQLGQTQSKRRLEKLKKKAGGEI